MADAGRVLLMPKGTYSSSTNYEVLDWVRYSNGTYASKHNNNQGNTPTGNPTDPHWALLCQDGSGGGSNVSWTQLVTSGTKIATIEIDGVQTDVYAPSGGGGSYSAGTGISISNNTISIDPGTITSGNQKPVTGDAVNTALGDKEDKSALRDLAYIDIDGQSSTKLLQGDGTWVTPSTGGHNMLDNSTIISGITSSISEGTTDDDVVSAYGVGVWANTDTNILLSEVQQGDTEMGTWEDDATWESGSRVGWLFHKALFKVLDTNSGIDIEPIFEEHAGTQDAIGIVARRIDDEIYQSTTPTSNPKAEGLYELSGTTYVLTNDTTIVSGKTYYVGMGAGAIKFNAPIASSGVQVGFKLTKLRTNVFRGIVRSSS